MARVTLQEIEEEQDKLHAMVNEYEDELRAPDFIDRHGEVKKWQAYECPGCRVNFSIYSKEIYILPRTRYREAIEIESWPYQASGYRGDTWICCSEQCTEVVDYVLQSYYSKRRKIWQTIQQASKELKLVRLWLKTRREVLQSRERE